MMCIAYRASTTIAGVVLSVGAYLAISGATAGESAGGAQAQGWSTEVLPRTSWVDAGEGRAAPQHLGAAPEEETAEKKTSDTVSYTHLDMYKRQVVFVRAQRQSEQKASWSQAIARHLLSELFCMRSSVLDARIERCATVGG